MEIKVLKNESNEIEIEIDNLTVAELLRVYLNKDSNVELAAWRREHFEKPVVLKIKTKGKTAKKSLDDAISQIKKDSSVLEANIKKAK